MLVLKEHMTYRQTCYSPWSTAQEYLSRRKLARSVLLAGRSLIRLDSLYSMYNCGRWAKHHRHNAPSNTGAVQSIRISFRLSPQPGSLTGLVHQIRRAASREWYGETKGRRKTQREEGGRRDLCRRNDKSAATFYNFVSQLCPTSSSLWFSHSCPISSTDFEFSYE